MRCYQHPEVDAFLVPLWPANSVRGPWLDHELAVCHASLGVRPSSEYLAALPQPERYVEDPNRPLGSSTEGCQARWRPDLAEVSGS